MAVDDLSSPYAFWPPELGELLTEDAAAFLSSPIRGFDVVYQFAAPVGGREKIEGDPLFNADSLRLDAAFFRWAVKSYPGLCIYPSSSAVYGTRLQTFTTAGPLGEDLFHPSQSTDIPRPDEMYGFTKLVGEMLAWKAAAYGVNTLCIRPFSGYGEDQSPEYPMPSICRRAAQRDDPLVVWGSGKQMRDFIHVDDVVGATVSWIGHVYGYQNLNIGWGYPVSFANVAHDACAMVGYKPRIENLPGMPAGVDIRFSDNTRMRTRYEPQVSLDEGIARMVKAYA